MQFGRPETRRLLRVLADKATSPAAREGFGSWHLLLSEPPRPRMRRHCYPESDPLSRGDLTRMKDFSRREILKKTAAAAMVAAPGVLPVLGQNNRLRVGWIATGARGQHVMKQMYLIQQGPGERRRSLRYLSGQPEQRQRHRPDGRKDHAQDVRRLSRAARRSERRRRLHLLARAPALRDGDGRAEGE